MPITKIPLKIQLTQLLDGFQAHLKRHFILRGDQEASARNTTREIYNQIIRDCTNQTMRYNAVLMWCSSQTTVGLDKFTEVKNGFNTLHKTHFNDYLKYTEQCCSHAIKKLVAKKEILKKELEHETLQLSAAIQQQNENLTQLKLQAKRLTVTAIPESPTHQDFQKIVRQLKRNISLIKFPSTPVNYQPISARELPTPTNLMLYEQQKILSDLDLHVTLCKTELDKQSFFSRVARFFSPSHWRHTAALSEYDHTVKVIPTNNIAKRYAAAEAWYTKHHLLAKTHQETHHRFHTICLTPFQHANAQLQFAQLPTINQKHRALLKPHEDVLTNAIKIHEQHLTQLRQDLNKTTNAYKHLGDTIDRFTATVNAIVETSFGYIQNNTGYLTRIQKSIREAINVNLEKEELAQEIAHDILTIKRHTPQKDLEQLQLKQRYATLTKSPSALAIVQKAIQQLIDETHKFAGKSNNFGFVGSQIVAWVVQQIGTPQQQATMTTEKIQAAKNKKNIQQRKLFAKTEHLVDQLKTDLHNYNLLHKLTIWFDAYQKHNGLNNKKSDVASEKIYQTQIKLAMKQAKQYHHSGCNKLYEFVQHVIASTLKTSMFNAREPIGKTPYEKLNPEQTTMLVLVFGTEAQQHLWENDTLPIIHANRASALKKVAAGQQHLGLERLGLG